LLLTAAYCAVLAHDLSSASAAERLSSADWFGQGFCNAGAGRLISSHFACFVCDLLGGGALLWENWRRYRLRPRPALLVAAATAVFTLLHGFGHLAIGHVLGADFMASVRPRGLSWPRLAAYYAATAAFLALGPFLGFWNGVRRLVCVVVHLASAWAFLALVPTQFAFGFVQLYLNVWYCAPRVALLGCASAEHVSRRVDDGWAVVSAGFLALMPVVFAEMLACDVLLMACGGHVVYDAAVVLISLAHSVAVWKGSSELEAAPAERPEGGACRPKVA